MILIYNGARYPFDPHRIVFGEPQKTQHGSWVVNAEYLLALPNGRAQKVPIILQTPNMRTTFGFTDKAFGAKQGESKNEESRAQVDLSFATKSQDAAVQAFWEVLELTDELTMQHAIKNKAKWFRDGNLSNEILRYLYKGFKRKNVRKSDGRVFYDDIKPRIQKRYGKYECGVFNHERKPFKEDNRTPLDLKDVTRGCFLSALLMFNGLWFASTSWSATFRALQLKLAPQQSFDNYSFVEDPEQLTDDANASADQYTTTSMMVDEPSATDTTTADGA